MSKYVSAKEAHFAVYLALEGQKWLKYKWEGEYSDKYRRKDGTNPTRDHRIAEINKDIERLLAFKEKL